MVPAHQPYERSAQIESLATGTLLRRVAFPLSVVTQAAPLRPGRSARLMVDYVVFSLPDGVCGRGKRQKSALVSAPQASRLEPRHLVTSSPRHLVTSSLSHGLSH